MSTGLGVMIGRMYGQKKDMSGYYGQIITKARLEDETYLRLEFQDGKKLKLFDDGQSCCEKRWMSTDDNVQWLVGKTLTKIELKDAEDRPSESDYAHEVQFLEVMTNEGCITFANHNEHNGYYGGFCLSVMEE